MYLTASMFIWSILKGGNLAFVFTTTTTTLGWQKTVCFRPGMHNIRPAKAFNLALEAQNFAYLACFFHKNILCMYKNL
jgi:hypothetical protein